MGKPAGANRRWSRFSWAGGVAAHPGLDANGNPPGARTYRGPAIVGWCLSVSGQYDTW
jgi:hypothetical protein